MKTRPQTEITTFATSPRLICRALGVFSLLACLSLVGVAWAQQTITCGSVVNGSITSPGQAIFYTINAQAGDKVHVTSTPTAGALEPDVFIYDSDNNEVGSFNYNDYSWTALVLTNAGPYSLEVHGRTADIGSYSLGLTYFTPNTNCPPAPLSCNLLVSNTISDFVQPDYYSLTANAGDVVHVTSWNMGGGSEPDVQIYNSTGAFVGSFDYNDFSTNTTLTFPSNATYTVIVKDRGADPAGTYSLCVAFLNANSGCPPTPLVCSDDITNTINNATQRNYYSITANAGEIVHITSVPQSGGTEPDVLVYNASGAIVGGFNYSDFGATSLTFPSNATYTVIVKDREADSAGTYSMAVTYFTPNPDCASIPLDCGEAITNTINDTVQPNTYSLAVEAGTKVHLTSVPQSGGIEPDVTIYSSAGVLIGTFVYEDFSTSTLTLTNGGIYTAIVRDRANDGAGTYTLAMTCFSGCSYSIDSNSISVSASGTNGTVNVTAGSSCGWTATNNVSWLHITGGGSGTGNGTVSYTVDANCNATVRDGNLTIFPAGTTNGFTFIVDQANPVTLTGVDIGDPGTPGSFSYSDCGTYTVNGSGEGTDGSADICYYAYQPVAGNAQIVARLTSLQGGDPQQAEAGIMMRQSLDPGSEQVSLSMDASTNVIFRRRLGTNDLGIVTSFQGNPTFGTNSFWLRLMRMGNTFVGHYSTNGLNWKYLWFTTVDMTNQFDAGLVVTAHHYGELATATFDNESAGSLTPLSGAWPLPGPKILLGEEVGGYSEFQRDGGFEFLLGGNVGDVYNVKLSPILTNPISAWPAIGTVTNVYGVVPYLDAGALTNGPHYYYRAQRTSP